MFLSFPPSSDTHVAMRISECLADISAWTTEHHLKLNLYKTELLSIPGKDCPCMDLSVTVKDVTVSPSSTARNLGLILDNRPSCIPNIPAVAWSCRFPLNNICRIQSFVTNASQLLVQVLVISHLDDCNSLLQCVQNTAMCLVFNLPKFSHVILILCDLHLLPVVACIQFKTNVLAFSAINRTAPIYLQTVVRPHTPVRALRSTTSAGWLLLPSLRANKGRSAKSCLFSALVPQWWN